MEPVHQGHRARGKHSTRSYNPHNAKGSMYKEDKVHVAGKDVLPLSMTTFPYL